jgi:hypothetical protein
VADLLIRVSDGKMFGRWEKVREGFGVVAGQRKEDVLIMARKAAFAGVRLAVGSRC